MAACCARAVPSVLLHLNIFLAVFAGAALATGARLKWDPSAYVPLRALFPTEYRIAAALLPAAAALLLVLAHIAAFALHFRRLALRRVLLLLYAFLMALMMCGEAAFILWARARFAEWARSPEAAEMRRALELRKHLQPLLDDLTYWHPLPAELKSLIQEAEADAPRNIHVCIASALVLALMQTSAVLLALLVVARIPRTPRTPRAHRLSSGTSTPLSTSSDLERAPMKAVYKRGRLVMT